ncbi:hypothetical protein [Parerythrobacter lacustris]|uniref:Sel1 repeat family protein n=1 Tax=Parerythrobacter lacustris TaxID=2969984 RepID=A0ABT1XNI8_9SPHN|nr:hypothetical protein [Parerythrobacter lacustris]MCR2833223.1 hypothetical protein [Parerythrobacter lacustris]
MKPAGQSARHRSGALLLWLAAALVVFSAACAPYRAAAQELPLVWPEERIAGLIYAPRDKLVVIQEPWNSGADAATRAVLAQATALTKENRWAEAIALLERSDPAKSNGFILQDLGAYYNNPDSGGLYDREKGIALMEKAAQMLPARYELLGNGLFYPGNGTPDPRRAEQAWRTGAQLGCGKCALRLFSHSRFTQTFAPQSAEFAQLDLTVDDTFKFGLLANDMLGANTYDINGTLQKLVSSMTDESTQMGALAARLRQTAGSYGAQTELGKKWALNRAIASTYNSGFAGQYTAEFFELAPNTSANDMAGKSADVGGRFCAGANRMLYDAAKRDGSETIAYYAAVAGTRCGDSYLAMEAGTFLLIGGQRQELGRDLKWYLYKQNPYPAGFDDMYRISKASGWPEDKLSLALGIARGIEGYNCHFEPAREIRASKSTGPVGWIQYYKQGEPVYALTELRKCYTLLRDAVQRGDPSARTRDLYQSVGSFITAADREVDAKLAQLRQDAAAEKEYRRQVDLGKVIWSVREDGNFAVGTYFREGPNGEQIPVSRYFCREGAQNSC